MIAIASGMHDDNTIRGNPEFLNEDCCKLTDSEYAVGSAQTDS